MNSPGRQFKQFALLMAQLLVFIASFVCFAVDLHSETLLETAVIRTVSSLSEVIIGFIFTMIFIMGEYWIFICRFWIERHEEIEN